MSDEIKLGEDGDFESAPTFTLYDEQTGRESEFVLLARMEYKGCLYYALTPVDDSESYVALSVKEAGDEIIFETIEDDTLFEEVVAEFDALLEAEYDYDD